MESLQLLFPWLFIALLLATLIVVLTRPPFGGKGLLVGYLVIDLCARLFWQLLQVMLRSGSIEPDRFRALALSVGSLVGVCALVGATLLLLFALQLGRGFTATASPAAGYLASTPSGPIEAQLATLLPSSVKIATQGTDPQVITLEQGLWRGVSYAIRTAPDGARSVVPTYYIPTWTATWILIIGTCVSISLLLTIAVTIAMGEFTPVAAAGGLVGAVVYMLIKALVVSFVRKGWAPDLDPVLRLLQGGAKAARLPTGV